MAEPREIGEGNRVVLSKLDQAMNMHARHILNDVFSLGSQVAWDECTQEQLADVIRRLRTACDAARFLIDDSTYEIPAIGIAETIEPTDGHTMCGVTGKVAMESTVEFPPVEPNRPEGSPDEDYESGANADEVVSGDVGDHAEVVAASTTESLYSVTRDRPLGELYIITWQRVVWLLQNKGILSGVWYSPSDILALDEDKNIFGEGGTRYSSISNALKLAGFIWNGKRARGARYMITHEVRLSNCHGDDAGTLDVDRTSSAHIDLGVAKDECVDGLSETGLEYESQNGRLLTDWGLTILRDENGVRRLCVNDEIIEELKLATDEAVTILVSLVCGDPGKPHHLSIVADRVNALLLPREGKEIKESRVKSLLDWVDDILAVKLEGRDSIFSGKITDGFPTLWRGIYITRDELGDVFAELGYPDEAVKAFLG